MKRKTDDFFPIAVASKLKTYVYRLIDPRNGETFYVGKGKGNRVFAHVCAEKKISKGMISTTRLNAFTISALRDLRSHM